MRVDREWECDGWQQSIESNQHFQISEVRTHTLSVPVNDQDRGGSDNLNAWRSDKKARHIRRKCEMFCSNRFLMARLFICLFVCFFCLLTEMSSPYFAKCPCPWVSVEEGKCVSVCVDKSSTLARLV